MLQDIQNELTKVKESNDTFEIFINLLTTLPTEKDKILKDEELKYVIEIDTLDND